MSETFEDLTRLTRRAFFQTGLRLAGGLLTADALEGCGRSSQSSGSRDASGAAGSFPDLRPQQSRAIREFRRIVDVGDVDVAPGARYRTWLYNGRFPGEEIRSVKVSGCE